MGRVLYLTRKEFIQIFRDPRMRRVIFVAPMIQLIVFGYAVSTDVRHTSTVVVDHDRTQRSREAAQSPRDRSRHPRRGYPGHSPRAPTSHPMLCSQTSSTTFTASSRRSAPGS